MIILSTLKTPSIQQNEKQLLKRELQYLIFVTRNEQAYLQSNKKAQFFVTRIHLQKIEKLGKKEMK